MTPLEMLALLAVIAVLLVGTARATLRRRERRRAPRELDPDYSPLQLYRTGLSRPLGTPRARPAERTRPDAFAPPAAMQKVQPRAPAPRPERPAQPEHASTTPRRPTQPEHASAPPPRARAQPEHASAPPPRRPVQPPAAPARGESAARNAETPSPRASQPATRPQPSANAQPRPRQASAPAVDGTLQLLPGRLEVLSGLGQREEIRFVKIGQREPAVTFGRSPGEPHLHVQLESPTVSRMHARMRRTDAGWLLSNLSGTNPVVVNGVAMTNGHEQRLEDGDRIEMGEVVFQYRAG